MTESERQQALAALVEERIERMRMTVRRAYVELLDALFSEGNVPKDSPLARLLVGHRPATPTAKFWQKDPHA